MRGRTGTTRWSVVLDSTDAQALAQFYRAMLDWRTRSDEPDWVTLEPDDSGGYLAFQTDPAYVPPVWPAGDGDQQMQLHLDIEVTDLEAAAADAVALGATVADYQPQEDVRVLRDPAGHVFCLWVSSE
jgi:predicted enzyme related to lactoylglutathione lyase